MFNRGLQSAQYNPLRCAEDKENCFPDSKNPGLGHGEALLIQFETNGET